MCPWGWQLSKCQRNTCVHRQCTCNPEVIKCCRVEVRRSGMMSMQQYEPTMKSHFAWCLKRTAQKLKVFWVKAVGHSCGEFWVGCQTEVWKLLLALLWTPVCLRHSFLCPCVLQLIHRVENQVTFSFPESFAACSRTRCERFEMKSHDLAFDVMETSTKPLLSCTGRWGSSSKHCTGRWATSEITIGHNQVRRLPIISVWKLNIQPNLVLHAAFWSLKVITCAVCVSVYVTQSKWGPYKYLWVLHDYQISAIPSVCTGRT